MIRIRGLCKAFGRNRVLEGLDLDIARGESLVVIGRSGTGKSVLAKNIIGLMQPDSGSIAIAGAETVGLGGLARDRLLAKFGVLFQGAALFDSLPVWENVAFGLIHNRRMDRRAGARSRDRDAVPCRARRRPGRALPVRALGRHAKARGPGPRHRRRTRDHVFRRAHHRARPDHGRCHQRPDRGMRARAWRDRAVRSPTTWRARARSPTGSR